MWWSSAASVFAIALAFTVLMTPMAASMLTRWAVVDVAGERSSHVGAVPRGGGLVIMAVVVVVVTMVAVVVRAPVWTVGSAGLAAASVAFAVLGGIDDRRSVPAPVRLVIQLLLAAFAAAAVAVDGHTIAALIAVPTLVGFVNTFNFMDGINGISGLTALVIAVSVVEVGWSHEGPVVVIAAAVAGSSLGFVVHNVRGGIFLGDVGSYFLGASLVALSLAAWIGGGSAVVLAMPFVPYIADVAATLVRRLRRGADVLRPHREHAYQRLANGRWSHMSTSVLYAALAGALAVLARVDTAVAVVGAAAVAGGLAVAGSRIGEGVS